MWLVYAMGGGWGHLTRAVALARAAQVGRGIRVLTNSPYTRIVAAKLPDLDMVALDPAAPVNATRARVLSELARCRPTHLIVDTFPRGLGGELAAVLPKLEARRILLHRDLNPRYVAKASLRQFVAEHYDRILVPGEGEGRQFGDLPAATQTYPWLVRSARELPPREPAATRYVLVCAGGNREEQSWYGAVTDRLLAAGAPVRCVAPELPPGCPLECWVPYWPAIDLLAGASVVVGGGGYNTVHECQSWNLPLVAKAWPRKYDRQQRRIARYENAIAVAEPEEAAAAALAAMAHPAPDAVPDFVNGAEEAVRHIADTLPRRGARDFG